MLEVLAEIFWGPPMAGAFLAVGLILTVRTGFFQFRIPRWAGAAGRALRDDRPGPDGISPRQAMLTALASTVGTGNIAGVATGIALGGPGAVVWMWIAALLGMATGFAENLLGAKYRTPGLHGPMAYLERGLGAKRAAKLYAAACLPAAIGVGALVQSNSAATGLEAGFGLPPLACGVLIAALAGCVIAGGARRLGAAMERLVPAMVALYLVCGAGAVAMQHRALPSVFSAMFRGAFQFRAAAGGGAFAAIRYGVSRGVFSNEAGLGSSVLAHSAAPAKDPVETGLWSIFEVFLDTIVVCTLTALVILTSGVGGLSGAPLATAAFTVSYGVWGGRLVAASMALFAFSTVLSWSFFGGRVLDYLFGGGHRLFLLCYLAACVVGAVVSVDRVWLLCDVCNGLMAVPNLAALLRLSGTLPGCLQTKCASSSNSAAP